MNITENYLNHCKYYLHRSSWDAQSKGLLVTRSGTFDAYMNVSSVPTCELPVHSLDRIPQTQWETCQQRSIQKLACLLSLRLRRTDKLCVIMAESFEIWIDT